MFDWLYYLDKDDDSMENRRRVSFAYKVLTTIAFMMFVFVMGFVAKAIWLTFMCGWGILK